MHISDETIREVAELERMRQEFEKSRYENAAQKLEELIDEIQSLRGVAVSDGFLLHAKALIYDIRKEGNN